MDTIQDQIRELQTSVRRQRFAIFALASILAGSALIGAGRPAGDATFDTITCTTWRVVDKDGKIRIVATTLPGGTTRVTWVDKDGKKRISAGEERDGAASVRWFDKESKERISAYAESDGNACVEWYDKRGNLLIGAGMKADGTVTYPTKDGK
jgi:uncharacterized protein YodC (DUF2158 family)